MFLQGDLQMVFDALYNLGVIDPVLEMDWSEEMQTVGEHHQELEKAVTAANVHQESSQELIDCLSDFEEKVLGFLAMEVAREFADFHTRECTH